MTLLTCPRLATWFEWLIYTLAMPAVMSFGLALAILGSALAENITINIYL